MNFFTGNKNISKTLMVTVVLLSIGGLLINISASMGKYSNSDDYALLIYTLKQLVYLVGGLILYFIAIRKFDFKRLKYWFNKPLVIYSVWGILLLCRLFPSIGGAYAWIRLPGFTLQPSEFAKIFVILTIANMIGSIKSKKISCMAILKPLLIQVLVVVGIVFFIQHDLGSATIILFIIYMMILVSSHPSLRKLQNFMLVLLILGVIGSGFLFSSFFSEILADLNSDNYMINRFTSAVDPFSDPYAGGYHIIQGLISMATGGFFGLGFGQSIRKYMNFPAANSDFIVAILIEELGLFGFLILVTLYSIILFVLISNALKVRDERARLVLFGTSMYLFVHFLFNVGGASTLIPLTGVPLLMVSSGGSSLLSCLFALGICQAVISMIRKGEIK